MTIFSEFQQLRSILLSHGATKVILAGGAVRDTVFGKPIKDMDIFFEGSLTPAFYKKYKLTSACEYPDHDFLVSNWKTAMSSIPVQLINVFNVLETVKNFPVNISRMYLENNFNGILCLDSDTADWENKILKFTPDCSLEYKNRIKEKYSDWEEWCPEALLCIN